MTTSQDRPLAEWFVRPDGTDASGTIHGLGHTRRVHIHAMGLGEALGLVPGELEALSLAALWHDIGRTHDGADYYHGAKSAGKAVALGLHRGIDSRVAETALYAITHHCGSEEHGELAASDVRYWERGEGAGLESRVVDANAALRVFRVLKDADALDRVRLGDLDASYLRFEVSRGRVERARELLRETAR